MAEEGKVFIGKYAHTFMCKLEGRLTQKSLWNMNAAIRQSQEDADLRDVIVDIAQCVYMDSTILGILARWAIAFAQTHPTPPFLIGLPGNPLEHILVRMSLDTLFHVSRDTSTMPNSALSQMMLSEHFSEQEYAAYVLAAHQTLAELSTENAKEFATVIECLKAELLVKGN
jgi:anti-anti-sigma regulatory factor